MGWPSKFSWKRTVYEGRNREAGGPWKNISIDQKNV